MSEKTSSTHEGYEATLKALAQAKSGVAKQLTLWDRIEKATGYLVPRKAQNHFSEGILQSLADQK